MLDTVKRKDFAKHLKETFHVQADLPEPLAFKLIEVAVNSVIQGIIFRVIIH